MVINDQKMQTTHVWKACNLPFWRVIMNFISTSGPIIEATNQHTISRATWGLELSKASSANQNKTNNINTNVEHEHYRSPRLVAHFRLLRLHWRCNCAAQSAQQRNKADLREADKATYSDWWPQVEVLWNSCIRTWGEQDSQGVQYVGAARS